MNLATVCEPHRAAVFVHGLGFDSGLHGKEAGKVMVHR